MKTIVKVTAGMMIPAAFAAPQITNLNVDAESSSAVVQWSMATPAIPSLDYGQTQSYELGTIGGTGSAVTVLDFEDVSVPTDSEIDAADFTTRGFNFDSTNDHTNFANGTVVYSQGPASNNGSTFVFVHGYYLDGWVKPSIHLSTVSGATFNLAEVKIAEYALFADASRVDVTGTYPSGSTVTTTIVMDGVLDGAGGADDFQTVTFGSGWSSLQSVKFQSDGGTAPFMFALDDIVVQEVVALETQASFDLENLVPATTYYFRANASDGNGAVDSVDNSFTTSVVTGGEPPIIADVATSTTDLTASIAWTTDQPAVGAVGYGLTTAYELGTIETVPISETVDFEDLNVPEGDDLSMADFSSGGFHFDISDDESTFVNGELFYGSSPAAFNGSTYLYIYGAYNGGWGYPTIEMTSTSGAPFSLHSLDYSEAATFVAANRMVVTGQTGGGETLRETFFLDGIVDGSGGLADFETASFGPEWDDLLTVTIQAEDGVQGALLAIDNIVLNETTELGTQHSFLLTGLTHDTEYHLQAIAIDGEGDVATSGDLLVKTTNVEDHDPPVITDINVVSEFSSSATVTWKTSELSETRIDYGLSTDYGLTNDVAPLVAGTIDFEDIRVAPGQDLESGQDIDRGDFTSGGFDFDISNDHSNFANGDVPGWNFNGSTYFFIHGYYAAGWVRPDVTMSLPSGGTFTLEQLDLGEVELQNFAKKVRITGTKETGAVVTMDVTMDEVLDGPGGADDFQTVTFGLDWSELVSVNFRSIKGKRYRIFALDNIQLNDSSGLGKNHSVTLSDLGQNLTYHYQVVATDESGNQTFEPDRVFVSGQTNDLSPPDVSNIDITPTRDSASISWDTSEWAVGTVDAGITQSLEMGSFGGGGSGLVTIDFETNYNATGLTEIFIPEDDDVNAEDFVSSNYLFEITDGWSNFLGGEVFFLGEPVSYNGTRVFFVHGAYNNGWTYPTVTVTPLQSETFTLIQMDVSEATFLANVETVVFEGTREDGSVVSRTHNVDMILDGSGPEDDFETLTFDSDWADLTSLDMYATAGYREAEVVYDNMVMRQGGGLNHNVVVTGLAPNTTHYLQVRSVDAAGNETLSSIQSFTTLP